MSSCSRIKINNKSIVCAGDLRYPIIIHIRDLTAPDNVDFGVDFTTTKTIRAGINIVRQINNIDGTNMDDQITHKFYIRYDNDADRAVLIEFDAKYYTVLGVEEVDFRKNYLILNTTERGISSNKVNLL